MPRIRMSTLPELHNLNLDARGLRLWRAPNVLACADIFNPLMPISLKNRI